MSYDGEAENAHGALLSERGLRREGGRRARGSRGLANADEKLGYSHAATGAYEGARKSERREVTGSHGANDAKSRRGCRWGVGVAPADGWIDQRSRAKIVGMANELQLTPRLIGQTEKAMNAILDRLLAGSGVSEPQWVALVLASSGEPQPRPEPVQALIAHGLLDGDGRVTDAGAAFRDRIGAQVSEVVHRLWGDLPPADLATTARVLETVRLRATA